MSLAAYFLVLLAGLSGYHCKTILEGDTKILQQLERTAVNSTIENGGCDEEGTMFAEGSAMASRDHCSFCYCIKGQRRCVKPKCKLPIRGCKPRFRSVSCCPTFYDCHRRYSTTISPKTTQKIQSEFYDIRRGCQVNGRRYFEGQYMHGVEGPCKACYCLNGRHQCSQIRCKPPMKGCTPVVVEGRCCPVRYECEAPKNQTKTSIYRDDPTLLEDIDLGSIHNNLEVMENLLRVERDTKMMNEDDIIFTTVTPIADEEFVTAESTVKSDIDNDLKSESDKALGDENNDIEIKVNSEETTTQTLIERVGEALEEKIDKNLNEGLANSTKTSGNEAKKTKERKVQNPRTQTLNKSKGEALEEKVDENVAKTSQKENKNTRKEEVQLSARSNADIITSLENSIRESELRKYKEQSSQLQRKILRTEIEENETDLQSNKRKPEESITRKTGNSTVLIQNLSDLLNKIRESSKKNKQQVQKILPDAIVSNIKSESENLGAEFQNDIPEKSEAIKSDLETSQDVSILSKDTKATSANHEDATDQKIQQPASMPEHVIEAENAQVSLEQVESPDDEKAVNKQHINEDHIEYYDVDVGTSLMAGKTEMGAGVGKVIPVDLPISDHKTQHQNSSPPINVVNSDRSKNDLEMSTTTTTTESIRVNESQNSLDTYESLPGNSLNSLDSNRDEESRPQSPDQPTFFNTFLNLLAGGTSLINKATEVSKEAKKKNAPPAPPQHRRPLQPRPHSHHRRPPPLLSMRAPPPRNEIIDSRLPQDRLPDLSSSRPVAPPHFPLQLDHEHQGPLKPPMPGFMNPRPMRPLSLVPLPEEIIHQQNEIDNNLLSRPLNFISENERNVQNVFKSTEKPTLPPSLPNLKIIPFVAADAVVNEETEQKNIANEHPEVCRLHGNIYKNGDLLPTVENEPCALCRCYFGQIICKRRSCPRVPEGCFFNDPVEGECCRPIICEKPINDANFEPIRIEPVQHAPTVGIERVQYEPTFELDYVQNEPPFGINTVEYEPNFSIDNEKHEPTFDIEHSQNEPEGGVNTVVYEPTFGIEPVHNEQTLEIAVEKDEPTFPESVKQQDDSSKPVSPSEFAHQNMRPPFASSNTIHKPHKNLSELRKKFIAPHRRPNVIPPRKGVVKEDNFGSVSRRPNRPNISRPPGIIRRRPFTPSRNGSRPFVPLRDRLAVQFASSTPVSHSTSVSTTPTIKSTTETTTTEKITSSMTTSTPLTKEHREVIERDEIPVAGHINFVKHDRKDLPPPRKAKPFKNLFEILSEGSQPFPIPIEKPAVSEPNFEKSFLPPNLLLPRPIETNNIPLEENDLINLVKQEKVGDSENAPLPESAFNNQPPKKVLRPFKPTDKPLPEIPESVKAQLPLGNDPILVSGLLELAGCNVYGRMFEIGDEIGVISGECKACQCTKVGVQCLPVC